MTDNKNTFGFFEVSHTADVSLNVFGRSIEELFVNAANGMYFLIEILFDVSPKNVRTIKIEEQDFESLLVAFLSELLFFVEKRIFICNMDLIITPSVLIGELIEVPIISYQREIKAVTFNELSINHVNGHFMTRLVFDI